MTIRPYESGSCGEMAALFYETVHTVNARDYTAAQLDAWAAGDVDLAEWDRSFREHLTLIAVEKGRIVGFGDMDASGYLDRLYVHKEAQRRGIASAICDRLEEAVAAERFTVHASITARPFFERRGYRTLRERTVVRRGVALVNYSMEKRRPLVF